MVFLITTYQPQVVITSEIRSVLPRCPQRTEIGTSHKVAAYFPSGWVHVGCGAQITNQCNVRIELRIWAKMNFRYEWLNGAKIRKHLP
jgi:hypothetical protein